MKTWTKEKDELKMLERMPQVQKQLWRVKHVNNFSSKLEEKRLVQNYGSNYAHFLIQHLTGWHNYEMSTA